jgi:NAD(P)-dependent dehydrogenase (short-subunit alcohol dehydrogenase family)
MSNRLEGKVALVTAAGQGIGRAIAEKFAAEGAKLIATDLEPNKLQGLRGKLRKLDVLARDDIEAFSRDIAREFGALDILVNCAGYVHQGNVLDCSDKDWDFSFDLNVKSMHHMIKTFLPGMLEKKSGSIVNIASAVSSIRGVPNRYVYGATKAAVISSSKVSAATPFARARSNRRRSASASPRYRRRAAVRSIRCARISSRASRWAGWGRPRRSLGWRSFSPATSRATSPATRISSMAAWPCNRCCNFG